MDLIDIIKTYFETDDRPTQAQFYQFFDGIFWRDTGLGAEGTFGAAGTIEIPEKGLLKEIVFWTDTNQNLKVGDTVGADDYEDVELTADTPYALDISLFSITGQTVYLTGQNLSNITFKFYMK